MGTIMKRISVFLVLLVMVLAITGCSGENAAKATVEKFFQGMKEENKQTIAAVLDLTFPGRDEFLAILDQYFVAVQYHSIGINWTSIQINSGVANISCITLEDVSVNGVRQDPQSVANTFTLIKRGSKWYITDWY